MKRSIYPSESAIQYAIVEWSHTVKVSSYRLSDFLIKISNEGKRGWFTGKKMKKEGLKKGVSDLFLALPIKVKTTFHIDNSEDIICESIHKPGLWMEIKSKKGKPSVYQMEWLALMEIQGYSAGLIFSVDEGILAIKNYLGMK